MESTVKANKLVPAQIQCHPEDSTQSSHSLSLPKISTAHSGVRQDPLRLFQSSLVEAPDFFFV